MKTVKNLFIFLVCIGSLVTASGKFSFKNLSDSFRNSSRDLLNYKVPSAQADIPAQAYSNANSQFAPRRFAQKTTSLNSTDSNEAHEMWHIEQQPVIRAPKMLQKPTAPKAPEVVEL